MSILGPGNGKLEDEKKRRIPDQSIPKEEWVAGLATSMSGEGFCKEGVRCPVFFDGHAVI
ncbi:hypothetical protein [Aureimonas sp. SA4125]|uniref:hypothetical protein n=1 Tax=Aureimonas sp. SA4125 TaxID=2826993 RepID=UPI001CC75EA8|nr:hypothetical protein [Aureimonas sp. SA4125]